MVCMRSKIGEFKSAFLSKAPRQYCVTTIPAFFLIFFLFSGVGCSHFFLQPHKTIYPFITADKVPFAPVSFESEDGVPLTGWYFKTQDVCSTPTYRLQCSDLKPQKARGIILQLHGNGENMSTHYRSVAWMALHGFDVFVFDYRSYGQSGGSRSVSGAIKDAIAAQHWVQNKAQGLKIPWIAYGQSLGGSLLLKTLRDLPRDENLKFIVVEGAFSSYPGIAREKLAQTWVTWPFQWLAYLLVSGTWSPDRPELARISPTPILFIYSEQDPIVPIHHGERMYRRLGEPKEFWRIPEPGHVNVSYVNRGNYREKLIQKIESEISSKK